MDFLIFRLYGDYAHFKKYYTTTSPLTFDFPPRTVASGIIGAILGLGKTKTDDNCYLKYFAKKDAHIGIRINTAIEKQIIPVNYLKTTDKKGFRGMGQRKQIRLEVVKKPDYTVYFAHNDPGLYKNFKAHLKNRHSVYTPYLGSSEFITAVDFIDEVRNIDPLAAEDYILVHSVLNDAEIKDIQFEAGREYMKSHMPGEMNDDRIVTEYIEALYERKGQGISCLPGRYYKIRRENISLL